MLPLATQTIQKLVDADALPDDVLDVVAVYTSTGKSLCLKYLNIVEQRHSVAGFPILILVPPKIL